MSEVSHESGSTLDHKDLDVPAPEVPEIGEFTKGFHVTPSMDFKRLRDTGLLWYINRVAFHPRGHAIALDFNDDGEVTGWALQSTDGTELFTFEADVEDDAFKRAEAFLGECRLLANQEHQQPEEQTSE